MASFIDDVIVETETEEEHDELVKKVVKRLAGNNLYVKPKKCKWKVKKVESLGVVIGLERIKMKKEKVKDILDWCQDYRWWTLFYFIFLFYFSFFPSFSIFRTAWVRVDWSRCHISHKLMVKSQD